MAIMFALTTGLTQPAQAQTFTVIHTFTGGADGASPVAGLTMDTAGNLYGTASTSANGNCTDGGCGTVFKLKHSGSSWVLAPLYGFAGGNDGAYPYGIVAIAGDGTLYGTTSGGGNGYGTVFHLTPAPTAPKTALAPWNETVLYRFTGGSDGAEPSGDLTFDQAGSIYGSAFENNNSYGAIYELTRSGGGWTQAVLYSPSNNDPEGINPYSGVIFDSSGNLYGTFVDGGAYNAGTVFQLSHSGSGWTQHTLYTFTGGSDGSRPYGGLIMDSSGNLYGTTSTGGTGGGGTVFELTPSSGGWTFKTLYSFSGGFDGGSWVKLAMDASENLYGTTNADGAHGKGSVFKLTPSGAGWTYASLYDFTGGSDGWAPLSSLVFDANGNLYGTTYAGGGYLSQCTNGCGVVFKITP